MDARSLWGVRALAIVAAMTVWAVVSVVGLLAAFVAVSWAIRRWAAQMPGGGSEIQVVGHRRLDMHTTLWVVEVDGRRLLIGSSRAGARLIADLADLADPTDEPK